jgi:hypothetical protein
MKGYLITFGAGIVAASIGWYLVWRNNRKTISDLEDQAEADTKAAEAKMAGLEVKAAAVVESVKK